MKNIIFSFIVTALLSQCAYENSTSNLSFKEVEVTPPTVREENTFTPEPDCQGEWYEDEPSDEGVVLETKTTLKLPNDFNPVHIEKIEGTTGVKHNDKVPTEIIDIPDIDIDKYLL